MKILIPVTNHANTRRGRSNERYLRSRTDSCIERDQAAAGFEYDIASIKGGKGPLYGTDIEGDSVNAEIFGHDDFQNRITQHDSGKLN